MLTRGHRAAAAGSQAPIQTRLWELDVARSVAIAMMVAYHIAYDVNALAPELAVDPFSGGWRALQVATGSSFLGLVGISAAISDERARARGVRGNDLLRRPLPRATQVLLAAALVTLATRVAFGDDYVRFGILHLIGVAMLLAPAAALLRALAAPLGVALILVGLAIRDVTSDFPGALIVGFAASGGAGVDHYPLLPWFGVVLIGFALGQRLYPGGQRGPATMSLFGRAPRAANLAAAPGRHALAVYLIHQPLLIPLTALGLTLAGVELSSFP